MVGSHTEPPSSTAAKPPTTPTNNIKFLCSYGGRILPRYPDGKLRYIGGYTRVLAVDRSISFPELLVKLGELCSSSVSLRCQLPTEDLDALVSIKSDEDLANLIEEYDLFGSSSLKIRAFLSPRSPSMKKILSPPSPSTPQFMPPKLAAPPAVAVFPMKSAEKVAHYGCQHCCRNPSHGYLIHNGNHWQ